MGSHNDDEANSRLEGSPAVWTADSFAPVLAFPACLRCTAAAVPVGLARHGAFVNGGTPFGRVLSVLLPVARVDAQHFQGHCFGLRGLHCRKCTSTELPLLTRLQGNVANN